MRSLFTLLLTVVTFITFGQAPQHSQNKGGWGPGLQTRMGSFYGKVLDGKTGKPVEFAPVQLFTMKFDSATKQAKQVLAGGQLSQSNGDFVIENVPVGPKYTLRIAAIGYQKLEMQVALEAKGGGAAVKDLGNIRLLTDTHLLKEIVVDGSDPGFRLEMDKKVYNVDKNPVNAGQTAQEVLRNVPSVNVDLDGNVTMRNSAPQIFVDGRPTTLTLEQIPADAIENVELITNPSAKYDAGSGMGGIINIVMKKNRKLGYNGNIRAGVDMRGRINTGGDFNIHQGKFNFFVSTMFNQRKSIGTSETERIGIQAPLVNSWQNSKSITESNFGLLKAGFDYFMDIRNTFTFSISGHQGKFNPTENIDTRSQNITPVGDIWNNYLRSSDNSRAFQNINSSAQYKHIFPKEGKELTADINLSTFNGETDGLFQTIFYDVNGDPLGNGVLQKQNGKGENVFTTIQTDYTDVIKGKFKVEAGLRGALKTLASVNKNMYYNHGTDEYLEVPALTTNYNYTDQVYAAYTTVSTTFGKLTTQAGLRVESSDYKGELPDSNLHFRVAYPLSLFPSGFASHKLSETMDIQFTYTRKVNRPGFFQLIPFTDFSDSLNFKRGNPFLKPEFVNAVELSLQKTISRGNSILFSVYNKLLTNNITGYQLLEYNEVYDDNVIINTFANANFARSTGAEITTRNNFYKFIDLTMNFNVFNSEINATNVQPDLKNERWSWFAKGSLNFKLPKGFSYQVSGDVQSKTAIPAGSRGGGMGGMGGGFGNAPTSVVQGYNWRGYEIDMAVRYDFLKNRAATITLSVSDLFMTEIHKSYFKTQYFEQNSTRRRDQRFFRLNMSYRFGKMDVNLFRRKNNRQSGDGMDMM